MHDVGDVVGHGAVDLRMQLELHGRAAEEVDVKVEQAHAERQAHKAHDAGHDEQDGNDGKDLEMLGEAERHFRKHIISSFLRLRRP